MTAIGTSWPSGRAAAGSGYGGTINIDADSTFAMALEGQARGHTLYHYLPQALTLRDGRLYAPGGESGVEELAVTRGRLRRREVSGELCQHGHLVLADEAEVPEELRGFP